jgi:hypothetical protein
MRYTYELYDSNDKRKDITTNLSEIIHQFEPGDCVKVFDNRISEPTQRNFLSYCLGDFEAIEEWQEKLARDYQWCDAPKPEHKPEYDYVETVDKMLHSEDTGSQAEHKKWDPFDEEETDIHTTGIHTKSNLKENLKNIAAKGKHVFSPIPPIALVGLGAAMNNGAEKYGLFNWRDSSVSSTVFYDAILRHLIAWYSGERSAPDSGVHHLGHVMAGCAILLDAEHNGVLIDDRSKWKTVTDNKFVKDHE